MKVKILFLIFLITLCSCETIQTKILDDQLNIVPIPKNVILDSGKRALVLTNSILYSINNPELNILLDLLEKDIESISSMDLEFDKVPEAEADLVFVLDKNLDDEEYSIQIVNNIKVNGCEVH